MFGLTFGPLWGADVCLPAAEPSRVIAPVTYSGRLPCADCPGIQLALTLFPDSTFRLRQRYEERPAVFRTLGRWSLEEDGTRLVLRTGPESTWLFRIIDADSLRPLDSSGRPIPSPFDNTLVRAPQVDPIRDTMHLRGMYIYLADAGRFTECLTGSPFPVAQIADNAALERAYVKARTEPGAPLLVSVLGHFEERSAMEGDRRLEHVVVDSFERVWPGATCEDADTRSGANQGGRASGRLLARIACWQGSG